MGGFTSGIDINVFDFVGHRLKKEELKLRKQALKAKKDNIKDALEMKQSPVRESKIDPNFADKFKPGQEELLRQLDAYAAKYANELNHKNTTTDNIEGAFSQYHWSVYRNMERQIEDFAEHSVNYVTDYGQYFSLVNQKDEDTGGYVYNRDMVAQDDVFLTEDMIELGEGETIGDYSWMWNANGDVDPAAKQTAMKDVNGDYVFQEAEDGRKFLLGEDGNRLTAYGKTDNGNVEKTKSGIFTFERIYNEDYNPELLGFDEKGNIMYGEEVNRMSFIDKWDRDLLNQSKIEKNQYSVDALWKIGEGLKYPTSALLDERPGSRNKYLTIEAQDKMREQLMGKPNLPGISGWNSSGDGGKGSWNSKVYGDLATHMFAGMVLKDNGNISPDDDAYLDIQNAIKFGSAKDVNGEYKGKLPEGLVDGDGNPFSYTSKYGSKPKIETYADYFNETILDRYFIQHPHINIAPPSPTEGPLGSGGVVWNDLRTKSLKIKIGENQTANNDAAYSMAIEKKFINMPRPWLATNTNDSNEVEINDVNDLGFISFNPGLTEILELGKSQGDITSGEMQIRAVDKRTGQLMLNATFDDQNGRFIFASEDDAKNAIIVAGLEGYWKPKDPDAITKNIDYFIEDESGESVVNPKYKNVPLHQLLKDKKGIEGFFPISKNLLTGKQIKGNPQEFINKAKTIKKVVTKDGEIKEFAMNEDDSIIQDTAFGFPGADTMMT